MAVILSIIIISINIFFVTEKLIDLDIPVYGLIGIAVLAICYFLFIIYLAIHLYVAIADSKLENHPLIEKFVWVQLEQPKQKVAKNGCV